MRELVLSVLLVVAIAGCKRPGSQKLEGRWRGQKADGVADTAVVNANLFATGTEIVVAGDTISINTPAGKNPPAKYFIVREEPSTLVIHTDRDGTNAETFTFNEKADTMIWRIDAQRSITFKKQTGTSPSN